MNLKSDLIENHKSIIWMNRCNALFIIKGFSKFEKLGYLEKFKNIYRSVDTHHMKQDDIEVLLKTKTNVTHFIIDCNCNVKDLISIKSKAHFMPIQLDFIDGNMNISSFLNPTFTGWFWNNHFQKELHYYRRKFFKQILKIDNVKDQLKPLSDELEKFWVKQSKRLHVTAMYIGRQEDDKSKNYLEKVRKQFFITTKAKVTGILLTPRNISGHVEITEDLKGVFDPDQQDKFKLLTHVTLGTSSQGKPVDSGPDQVDVQTMINDKKTPVQEFELEIGKLQDWGQCRFYVSLNKALNYKIMFLPSM